MTESLRVTCRSWLGRADAAKGAQRNATTEFGNSAEGRPTMLSALGKTLDMPDEVHTPPKANVVIVDINESKVARFTLELGWRWDESGIDGHA